MIEWLKNLFRREIRADKLHYYRTATDRAGRRLYTDRGKPIPIEKRVYP